MTQNGKKLQNGSKIKEIRKKETAFTQEQMADHLGVTQSTYSRIERDETPITFDTVTKIAEKLATDPKKIINDKEIKEIQNIFTQNFDNQSNSIGSHNQGTFNYNDPQVVDVIQDLRKAVENFQGIFSVLLEKLPR